MGFKTIPYCFSSSSLYKQSRKGRRQLDSLKFCFTVVMCGIYPTSLTISNLLIPKGEDEGKKNMIGNHNPLVASSKGGSRKRGLHKLAAQSWTRDTNMHISLPQRASFSQCLDKTQEILDQGEGTLFWGRELCIRKG